MPTMHASFTSRFPMERMLLIHERLKAGRYPNARKISKEFEVCARTIKRDILFMRDRLRLPIEYDEHRYGYYYTKPVGEFPSIPLSEREMFALLVARKAVEQYRGTPFEQPLADAFRRLSGQLDPQTRFTVAEMEEAISFRPFAPGDAALEQYEILTRALRQRRTIRFLYQGLKDRQAAGRRANPYHLACVDSLWYLFAFDLDRRAMRTFALPRMADVEILPGTFSRPRNFNVQEHLKGALGVHQGTDGREIVVEFDPWAARLVRERRWHPSQKIEPLPGGGCRLTMVLGGFEEVERWILSWGEHATAVAPPKLVQRMRGAASKLWARYAEQQTPIRFP